MSLSTTLATSAEVIDVGQIFLLQKQTCSQHRRFKLEILWNITQSDYSLELASTFKVEWRQTKSAKYCVSNAYEYIV